MIVEKDIYGKEYHQGVCFSYDDVLHEYCADAYNHDAYEKTGVDEPIFSHTDITSLEDMVLNLIMHYELDIDLFENHLIKDAFLTTLKLHLALGNISGEKAEHAKDWYLSDNTKFKVME